MLKTVLGYESREPENSGNLPFCKPVNPEFVCGDNPNLAGLIWPWNLAKNYDVFEVKEYKYREH